jgi:hypothetical protein
MFPASTNGNGQCFGFPDVCKTPTPAGPVPIPYPNIAMCNQADGGSCADKVKIVGKKAIVKTTEIPMSSGDEPGSAGGVISSKFKGNAQYKKGSSKVKFGGKEACHLVSVVGMNGGSNANVPAGQQVAPSQSKVKVTA